jgi:chemotaxis receptor (MCP) glutamine deamidase CheD
VIGVSPPQRIDCQTCAVTDSTTPEVNVAFDNFEVTRQDVVLIAHLQSTFALCIYDAVQESGAMLHLRAGPPGRSSDPNLTDNTLSTDLLLLDRCLSDLCKCEPRAKHWQAKVVGHVEDTPGARERFEGIQQFLTVYLTDTQIELVSCSTHVGLPQLLRFRPAMGHVRSETTQLRT